jgi:polyphosphate kinase
MIKNNNPAHKTSEPPQLLERYLSRDLSWLKFNERVLDQVGKLEKTVFEWLNFLHLSASNLDEFFMVRIGSLYNYIDYNRTWLNKLGLNVVSFRDKLLKEARASFQKQHEYFIHKVKPACEANHFLVVQNLADLNAQEQAQIRRYFEKEIFPMLTPMVFDSRHVFPALMNKVLVFGVVTNDPTDRQNNKKISFIQLPQNLARFYRLHRSHSMVFVPFEEIIRAYLATLFRSITILSVTLFRVIRNGDFSLSESDDIEASFVEALKRKLKKRNKGRVVRVEIEDNHDPWLVDQLKHRWNIDQDNVFQVPWQSLMDLTGLQQLVRQSDSESQPPVPPISCPVQRGGDFFEVLKQQDVLLHHPYNSIDLVIEWIERAAEDPYVLAIKMTIYRLARDSSVTAALCKAAECGKHVSVLIEIKARFDEEYNMKEAKKLEKAGCFVIYGVSSVKTHAKMMMIVRREDEHVTRYVHLSSGNYNEETAKGYADISLMTTDEVYANDVSEFFNVVTGHSMPTTYNNIITAPIDIRKQLTDMIRQEAHNAQKGLPCGIVIKVNALEDEATIEELYKASQAGVPIQLIVRGICCLIPQRPGLSTNITVRSIVGDFLEHARIFYFHNRGDAKVYAGSADIMVRSFEKRIESLFIIKSLVLKQQVVNILSYNLRDNVNSYLMKEDGSYVKITPSTEESFDIHKAFFELALEDVMQARLFA